MYPRILEVSFRAVLLTPVNGLAALAALFAALAWWRSAALALGWALPGSSNWVEGILNRISTRASVWNAIAAALAVLAAVLQGVAFALPR